MSKPFTEMTINRQEAAALLDMLPALIESGHPNLTAGYGGGHQGREVLEVLHETIFENFDRETS